MRGWGATLVVVALALAGCDPGESGDDRVIVRDQRLGVTGVDKLKSRRLEQFASLSLPASGRMVRSYASEGMDSMVEATIEMDAKDVDEFIADSELPALRRGPAPFDPGSGKRIGWKPSLFGDVRVAEDRTARGVERRVAVTRDGTVYLQAFET